MLQTQSPDIFRDRAFLRERDRMKARKQLLCNGNLRWRFRRSLARKHFRRLEESWRDTRGRVFRVFDLACLLYIYAMLKKAENSLPLHPSRTSETSVSSSLVSSPSLKQGWNAGAPFNRSLPFKSLISYRQSSAKKFMHFAKRIRSILIAINISFSAYKFHNLNRNKSNNITKKNPIRNFPPLALALQSPSNLWRLVFIVDNYFYDCESITN